MSRPRLIALLLAFATLLVYLPVTRHGFINYDDDEYVTNNQIVQNGLTLAGLKWAFTTFHASNWHPLTWLSHMTDCELFGPNVGAHHLVNVLFHAANVVLLFALLRRLTGVLWPAAFIAALFAWHPLHVESVAWIAERKDVLSTFFALLALLNYVHHVKECRRQGLWFALVFFALGLMAKPMLVTLPFVMLLLDYWPLQRILTIRRLVFEKWAFFLLALLSCVITVIAQHHGHAIVSLKNVPFDYRLENIPVAYAGYLQKIFWPVNLAVIYPMPEKISALAVMTSVAVLILISAFAWAWRKRAPYLPVGWLWFLGMLVPVIGLVQVGGAALADRYTYFSATGIFLAITFGACELAKQFHIPKRLLSVAAVVVLVACMILTEIQLRFWQDSETLFRHAVGVTKNNDIALVDLGVALDVQGQFGEALDAYHEAARIIPGRYQIHNNLGNILGHLGRTQEALTEYREAARLEPDNAFLHNSAGEMAAKLGRFDEADSEFSEAARLEPNYASPHLGLAKTLLQQGRDSAAIDQFHEALRLEPDNFQILAYAAHVLAAIENPQIRDGKTALILALKANSLTGGVQPLVLDALGMAYAETGDFTNATEVTKTALDLASAAKLKQTGLIRQRLELYQNHQPWRESFLATNTPPPVPPKN